MWCLTVRPSVCLSRISTNAFFWLVSTAVPRCGQRTFWSCCPMHLWIGWLGSRVVSVLNSGAEGPGFKSQPGNSLRQAVHTHRAFVYQAAKLVAALLRVARVTAGLAERLSTAGLMTHATCRLAAQNRDQLRNPALGNRVWATFTFYTCE